MSKPNSITARNLTRNQGTFDRQLNKIFVWNNEYETGTFLNNTGGTLNLVGGEVIGRVHATGQFVILKSASVDGSQYPVGINTICADVLDTATIEMQVGVNGNIDEGLLIFDGSDTLDTVVDNRRLRDRLAGDTVGLKLRTFTENTKFDN
jgi:hypothetical protein